MVPGDNPGHLRRSNSDRASRGRGERGAITLIPPTRIYFPRW
jgi:hypothetical protein